MSQQFVGTTTLTANTVTYLTNETSAPVYRCTTCDRWFARPVIAVSCCVLHSGGCCHYGETEMNPPTPKGQDRAR